MHDKMLNGRKILILADEMFEDLELHYPLLRLREEGAEVTIAGKEMHGYKGKNGLTATPDITFDKVSTSKFDALLIPGGYAPDHLRRYPEVLKLVKQMNDEQKPIAFICHAAWVPISAGILRGKRATCFSSIKDDLINAGANYEDAEVVRDGNLISSRKPADLGAFCREIISSLSEAASSKKDYRKSA